MQLPEGCTTRIDISGQHIMTTADSVLFYRQVVCFGLLLGYKQKWKLGDFGLIFARG